MSLTQKQVRKLHCLALLDRAATDEVAAGELYRRANNWETCAIGEQAAKLNVNPHDLYQADPKREHVNTMWPETRLETLGMQFYRQVQKCQYGYAKRTYHTIARRVKLLFGTKAKRVKLGLETA